MVDINLSLRQTQRLAMTPQLYQAIKILQLSTLELRETITEELEQNPLLEELANEAEMTTSLSEASEMPEETRTEHTHEEIIDYFSDSSDSGYTGEGYDQEAADNKQKFIEGVLNRAETLREHLLWQLHVTVSNDEFVEIGELLISNINNDGYLGVTIQELAGSSQYSEKKLEKALSVIQSFEPNGVGARDLRECLLIQVKMLAKKDPYAEAILAEHFDLLSGRKHAQLAKKLGISEAALEKSLTVIQSLNPKPGHEFDTEKPRYVVPDVIIEKKDGKFEIIMNDIWVPRLRVSASYRNMIQNGTVNTATKQYLKEKYSSAIWLIRSIEQRRSTLYKVTSAILEVQQKFFERGKKYLIPLTLREIAERISMHESTVSRVTTEKYAQTPWGIFELKYFFSSHLQTANGEQVSSQSVKELIKNIVASESETALSDQDIVQLLAESGIHIARRTVTKYRKKLNILPSNLRKK